MNINAINPNDLAPEDKVSLAYIALLERRIDDVGLTHWQERIATGQFHYKECLDAILSSPEYVMHFKVPFSDMVHRGRQTWIRSLGPFDTILDIGGSSANIAMGAMIELGYQHRPKRLVIFDLPEDKQYWGTPKNRQDKDYQYEWGTVHHVHGYAENIVDVDELRSEKFDLIFMGQAIEHFRPERLPNILRWIHEHMREQGKFIFDTPNRTITKIQIPNGFIDSDHKYEYSPHELQNILDNHGFRVTKSNGILSMPSSYTQKHFDPLEVYETALITEQPETSYLFAFECTKKP